MLIVCTSACVVRQVDTSWKVLVVDSVSVRVQYTSSLPLSEVRSIDLG